MNNTRILLLFIVLFSFAGILSAQMDSSKTVIRSDNKTAEIEFDCKIEEALDIGYANSFYVTNVKLIRGSLKETELMLTVLTGDKEIMETLKSGDENTVFRFSFVFNADNEKYSTAYITGFVDSWKTSWKLTSLVKKSKE